MMDIPLTWANGQPLSDYERRIAQTLRKHGCECSLPLFGFHPGDGKKNYKGHVGWRCRMCNTEGAALDGYREPRER